MFSGIHDENDRKKIRALPWHLAHGALTSIFFLWTFGGSVFVLFLSDLGLPKDQIGILLSFFPFSGLLALFFAPLATRLGRKRVFIAGYGTRYFVIINLVFLPWLIDHIGRSFAIFFLFAVLLIVAILRAIGETAYYPWSQEFIPNSVRGLYSAVFTAVSTLAAALALVIAGRVIGAGGDIQRYLLLIAVGTGIGLAGIIVMRWIPGGAPDSRGEGDGSHFTHMRQALRDPNYAAYLRGMGGVMLGSVFITSFLPLYLRDQLGLPPGTVVTLDTIVMIAGALSSIAWGWAADRLGSRPILMSSLAIGLCVPAGWLLLPRQVSNPILWCGLLYFLYGVIANGSAIGAGRLLFNRVIAPEKSTSYTAIYYAWMGLTGGLAPLLAGWILTLGADLTIRWGSLVVDGHSLLFLLGFILLVYGIRQYSHVAPDGNYTTRLALRQIFRRVLGF